MNASAFFSGGAPPPPGGGGGDYPPPPAAQHNQQQQYGQQHHQTLQRTHSQDSNNGEGEFETLDLDATNTPGNNNVNIHNVNNANNAGSNHNYSNAITASTGPENFSNRASSGPEIFSNYGASATASAGPENFSMPSQHHQHQQQQQQQQQQQHHSEEHFEYEGVALQTAMNAFGNVASVAGGAMGSLSGAARNVGGSVRGASGGMGGGITNVAGGITNVAGGIMGAVSVTPSKLAGGMASWRGRLADVVAPVPVDNNVNANAVPPPGQHGQGIASASDMMVNSMANQSQVGQSQSQLQAGYQQQPQQVSHGISNNAPQMMTSQVQQQPQPVAAPPMAMTPVNQQPPTSGQMFGMAGISSTSSSQPQPAAPASIKANYGRGGSQGGSAADIFAAPSPKASPMVNAPQLQMQSSVAAPPMTGFGQQQQQVQVMQSPQIVQQPVQGLGQQQAQIHSGGQVQLHGLVPPGGQQPALQVQIPGQQMQMQALPPPGQQMPVPQQHQTMPRHLTPVAVTVASAEDVFGTMAPPTPFGMNTKANPTATTPSNSVRPPTLGNSWQMVRNGDGAMNNNNTGVRDDGGSASANNFFGAPSPSHQQQNQNRTSMQQQQPVVMQNQPPVAQQLVPAPVEPTDNANDFFGAPSPSNHSSQVQLQLNAAQQQQPPMVHNQPATIVAPLQQPQQTPVQQSSNNAGDFFGAPSPANGAQVQASVSVTAPPQPQQQPQQQQQQLSSAQPDERKRQFSHRLSSLEKATRDPNAFQYADPLEGRATIDAGRNGGTVGGAGAGVGDASVGNVGNVMARGGGGGGEHVNVANNGNFSMGLGENVAQGASGGNSNPMPAAPATGGLKAMEIGKYSTPTANSADAASIFGPSKTVAPKEEMQGMQQTQTRNPASKKQPFPTPFSVPPAKTSTSLPTPQRSNISTISSKITTASSTSTGIRRLHLPVPKKTSLPLPPARPVRSKIAKPPTSGNSAGFSLTSMSIGGYSAATGGSRTFRKPPPMEIGAASIHTPRDVASPRFHVPAAKVASPRFHAPNPKAPPPKASPAQREAEDAAPVAVKMSPLPSPRLTAQPAAAAAEVAMAMTMAKMSPLPSLGVEKPIAIPVMEPSPKVVTRAAETAMESSPMASPSVPKMSPLPSPIGNMTMPSPAAETKAIAAAEFILVDELVKTDAKAESTTENVDETTMAKTPDGKAMDAATIGPPMTETPLPSLPPARMQHEESATSNGTGDDWNLVADSVVNQALDSAVKQLSATIPAPAEAPLAAASPPPFVPAVPPVAPMDNKMDAMGMSAPPITPVETSIAPLSLPVAHSSSSAMAACNGLHPTNMLPENLPTVPSSRITECDAMSDYQSYVRDEDIPPVGLLDDGDELAAEACLGTEMEISDNIIPECGVLAEAESSMVVETDGMSDYQDQLNEEDVPEMMEPVVEEAERANSPPGGVPPPSMPPPSLPQGWVEATDPTSGMMYYYNQATGATQWDRPIGEPIGEVVNEKSDETADRLSEDIIDKELKDNVLPKAPESEEPAQDELLTEPASEDMPTNTEGNVKEDEHDKSDEVQHPEDGPFEANVPSSSLPEGWIEATDPSSGKMYYYNDVTGESSWEYPVETNQTETTETTEDSVAEPLAVVDVAVDAGLEKELKDDAFAQEDLSKGKEEMVSSSLNEEMPAKELELHEGTGNDIAVEENDRENSEEMITPEEPAESLPQEADVSQKDSVDASETSAVEEPGLEPQALPEGWVEAGDPSSGGTYYFNEITGESRWDRPVISEDEPQIVEKMESESIDVVDDTVLEPTSDDHASTEPAADDDDADSASIQSEASEMHNEPLSTDGPVESDNAADLSFESLPGGWVESTDPQSGKIYYYNQESGESSWDRPMADVAPPDVVTEEVSDDEDEGNEENAAEPVIVDDGEPFVETTAEYGEVQETLTNIVHHEPAEETDNDIEPPTSDDHDGVATPVGEPVNENEKPSVLYASLPSGWIEAVDESSGKTYYYNEETGESLWERPVGDDDEDEVLQHKESPADEAEPEPTLKKEVDLAADDTVEQASELEELAEETNQPSEEILETDQEADQADAVISQAEGDLVVATDEYAQEAVNETEDDNAGESSSTILQDEWTEATDPASGNVYYYNSATGATSWTKPESKTSEKNEVTTDEPLSSAHESGEDTAEMLVKKSDVAMEDAAAPVELHGATKDEDLSAQELVGEQAVVSEETISDSSDEGWTRVDHPGGSSEEMDEATTADGKDHGPATEGTAEAEPSENEDQASLLEVASQNENCLPEGWVETTDPTSKKTYYYNEISGDSSWERPISEMQSKEQTEEDDDSVEVVGDELKSTVPSADFSVPEAKEADAIAEDSQQKDSQDQESLPEDECEKSKQEESELPDGWAEATDPNSGKVYYYHDESNTCLWERPGGQHPKPESVDEPAAISSMETEQEVATIDDPKIAHSSLPDPDAEEEASQVAEDSAVATSQKPSSEQTPASDDANALPEGWAEATDSSSAKFYYYNATTGATSWDRPQIEPLNDDISLKEDESNDDSPDEVVNAPTEQVTQDPSVDEKTEEITTTEADAEPCSIPEDDSIEADEALEPTPTLPEEKALLDGWVEASDPNSGNIYYYNNETGESAWERPVKDDTIPEGADTAEDSSNEPTESDKPKLAKDGGISAPKLAPLPDEWTEVADPNSGKVYYFNESSGETTWERPEELTNSKITTEGKDAHPLTFTNTNSSSQHRPRPAHAIASFAFGGRLCVMIPQEAASLSSGITQPQPGEQTKRMRRGPVVIHRLRDLIPRDHECSIPKSIQACSPLMKTSEDQVLSYLSEKCASLNDENMLWNVINIAAQNRGRLRNDKKAKGAIVDLLLATKTENKSNGSDIKNKTDTSSLVSETSSNLDEVQDLLLKGLREDAVSEALSQRNYALALVIASMCDRTTYQIAAKRFADEALAVGSPLHTASLLFSNNLEMPRDEELMDPWGVSESSLWGGDEYGDLVVSWREQLASIMSNQTVGWERIVLTLGDRLLQLGECHAAHVCYLVSFSPFGPPSKSTTRLVLLGCDHRSLMNRMLMTPQSIESFERTEAFEWARRQGGNRKTHIPSLQPFKLRYAELLADFGYEEASREYLLSIRSCIGLVGGSSDTPKSGGISSGSSITSGNFSSALLHYDCDFIDRLKRLDDRICVSTGSEQSSWDAMRKDDSKGAASALGSIVKNVFGGKKAKKEVPPKSNDEKQDHPHMTKHGAADSHLEDDSNEQLCEPKKIMTQPFGELKEPPGANDVSESIPEPTGSFIPAKPTFEKHLDTVQDGEDTPRSPALLNPFSHNVDHARDLGGAKGNVGNDDQGPPASAPPMFGDAPSINDEDAGKPQEEEKSSIVPSTPDKKTKKKDDKVKPPASEPAPRSGLWTKFFGARDPDAKPKAKVADTGEAMQAYYDEKLKRWIFPGDDPAEVAKPLAPPPLIPKSTDAPATPAPAAPSSSDPLAALMAPPPSRGRKIPSMRYADPLASMGNLSSGSGSKKVPDSPMMKAPPTFAVFQPIPAASKSKTAPVAADTPSQELSPKDEK